MSLKSKISEINKSVYSYALYSSFLRDIYKFRTRLVQNFPMPKYIEIETTTKCGLKCVMCEHTYWNEPSRDMTIGQFKTIIDGIPTLKWVGLTGIGESFLNKDYIEMLKYLKLKGIKVEIFDPFLLMNEKMSMEVLDSELELIWVSLDAATKETYEKIRVGSNFDVVIKNIKRFIELRKERNGKKPNLQFHFIISKYNISELEKYVELVHSFGIEKPKILFTSVLHNFKEVKDMFIESVPEETIRHVNEKAKELGVHITWNANVPEERKPITKCFAWLMPFIFVSGDVSPCCASNEMNERGLQLQNCFGNVYKQPFKDIWYGKSFTEFRKKILKGEVPAICRKCTIYDTKTNR